MTQTETQAIVTLSLMAAFVDGDKHDRERAEVRRIAEGLAQSDAVHLPTLVQDVLMKRVDLAGTAAALRSADTRQLVVAATPNVPEAELDRPSSTPPS
jgi:DnaJ-domain-containing protein 1